jgi:hypothetical protein
MLANAPPVLGRRARPHFGGPVTAAAYGNAGSPDLEINSDTRGAPAAYPGHGLLRFLNGLFAGYTSYGGERLPTAQTPGAWYDPGGPGGAYGGGWSDGVLTVRDRHVLTRRGYVRNPEGGGNSAPSPDAQAPPPPRYQMVDSTESWQLGTDHTTQEDNTGQHNSVQVVGAPARSFPLGQQDGTETIVMGPPLGEWRQYGVRGVTGMTGPAPDQYDVNTKGAPTLTVAGAPGMQTADRRVVYGGVPHGLHSPTENSSVWTGARFSSTPQMQPPRLDRPANSKIAGQSMSQGFPPESAAGNSSRAWPRSAAQRIPGLTSRFAGRS